MKCEKVILTEQEDDGSYNQQHVVKLLLLKLMNDEEEEEDEDVLDRSSQNVELEHLRRSYHHYQHEGELKENMELKEIHQRV
ncbi:hypothetical protein Baya_1637 [Bagarius yarrelli]|uniref:Uncharacterized protein n=1 Tax=Bagarius yarrelli TaxID=175774 RepID=A0A556TLQ8_BAGYA|nr:hypothetical protein Baya_1637 [Bagarius yarrelli]